MRKHLYLVTEHSNDELVGALKITDSRIDTVVKNEEGKIHTINRETHERGSYNAVGLGYHDFEDEDDYEDRAGDIIEQKLGEIDEEHLEKAGIDPETVVA